MDSYQRQAYYQQTPYQAVPDSVYPPATQEQVSVIKPQKSSIVPQQGELVFLLV